MDAFACARELLLPTRPAAGAETGADADDARPVRVCAAAQRPLIAQHAGTSVEAVAMDLRLGADDQELGCDLTEFDVFLACYVLHENASHMLVGGGDEEQEKEQQIGGWRLRAGYAGESEERRGDVVLRRLEPPVARHEQDRGEVRLAGGRIAREARGERRPEIVLVRSQEVVRETFIKI